MSSDTGLSVASVFFIRRPDLFVCLLVSSPPHSFHIHFSDSCLHFPNTLSLLQVINIYNIQIGRIRGMISIGPQLNPYADHCCLGLNFMASVGGPQTPDPESGSLRVLVNKLCIPVIHWSDHRPLSPLSKHANLPYFSPFISRKDNGVQNNALINANSGETLKWAVIELETRMVSLCRQ